MPVYLGTQQVAVRGGTQAGQGGGSTPKLEGTKYVTPDKNSHTITYGSGYDGLSKVVVYPIPDAYIKPASTLSTKTWTPKEEVQKISAGTYCEGEQIIAAIPSDYVKPTSKKAADTYTPGLENQTIAAGTYLTGTQTIEGDSNLIASNIKSGVKIFNVTGSYVGNVTSGDGNGIIPTYTQTAKEWTPKTSDQFIEAGTYCEGRQVIKGDENLKSGNIKSGVSIFNVIGTYDLPIIGLSNEGAAEHLLSGKQLLDTDYEIVTGSMPNNSAMTGTISTKTETITIPKGYHNGNGKVSISSSEQEKIIASNIKSGTTILGVTGNYNGPDNAIVPTKTLGITTYVPNTGEIRIEAGTYCEGDQIIPGDTDLKAENIKAGTTIFNIAGSYTGPEGNVVPTTKLQYKEWTPKAANQTIIEAGTYCEGQQVIKGDTNLVASKIKSGETIFGVTGNYEGPSGYVVPTSKKTADTYTPNTDNITIAAGTYLEGDQTILGDSNLKSENIKSGVSIFGIPGSFEGEISGGKATLQTKTATGTGSTTLSFTGLVGEPTMYSVIAVETVSMSYSSTGGIVSIRYDGTTTEINYGKYQTMSGSIPYATASIGSYSNDGTLTLTSNSTYGNFVNGVDYKLLYITDKVSSGGNSGGVTLPSLSNEAAAAELLSGKQLINSSNTVVTGTMTDRGAVTGSITNSNLTYTIPAGYHNGSGKVSVSSNTLLASNIKQGVSILGVTGTYTGGSSSSSGIKINKATAEQVTISGSYGSSISIEYSQNEPTPIVNANGTSITLGFTNSEEISRVSSSTDLSVLSNTYALISSGTYGTTTATCYYIPQSSTCSFTGGSGITSTSQLTITSAQKVTMSLS